MFCGGFAECRLFFVCQIIFALYRSVVLVFARAAGNKEQCRLSIIAYAERPRTLDSFGNGQCPARLYQTGADCRDAKIIVSPKQFY